MWTWSQILWNILICLSRFKWRNVDLLVLLVITKNRSCLFYFVVVRRPHLSFVSCSISLQPSIDSDLFVIALVYVTGLWFLKNETKALRNIHLTWVLWILSLRWLWGFSRYFICEIACSDLCIHSYLVVFLHDIFHCLLNLLLIQFLIIKLVWGVYFSKQLFLFHGWELIWSTRTDSTWSRFGISIHWDVSVVRNCSLRHATFYFLWRFIVSLHILRLVWVALTLTVLFLRCHLFAIYKLDTTPRNNCEILRVRQVWGWCFVTWAKLIFIDW